MVNALHLISVQRGYDPRDFVLVAFGGAGPVHANALARDTEMPTLLIPASPGVFSATGLLGTDLKRDASITLLRRLGELDAAEVEATFAGLEAAGAVELEREGVARGQVFFDRQIDMRYVGQSFELTIPLTRGVFSVPELGALLERFHAEHDRMYGFSAPGEPVECVSLRVTTVGQIERIPQRPLQPGCGDAVPKGRRQVYFSEAGGFVDCAIYDRYALAAGAVFPGPAVVEEFDSTVVVHPGYAVAVDDVGNLVIEREEQ
jgi:N-methylhydantoinase A